MNNDVKVLVIIITSSLKVAKNLSFEFNKESSNFQLEFRHLFSIGCIYVWVIKEVRLELSIIMDLILQETNQIGEDKIKCQICKEELDRSALELHFNTHHNEKPSGNMCEICEKKNSKPGKEKKCTSIMVN